MYHDIYTMAPQSILMIHPSYLGVQLEFLMGITFNRGNNFQDLE